MAEQILQVPPNSSGLKLRVQEISVGGNTVEMENIVVTGADGVMASVTGANALKVDNSAVTQPVSAAALPLPSGASTSAKQDTEIASLASIDGKITAVNTGAVVVSSSALPSGASTSAKQDTQIAAEQAIQTAVELLDDAIKTDDAAFIPATTKVLMAGFEFDDGSPDSVDEGDAGAARMSARREQYVLIRDAAGNERGLNIDASGQLAITVATIPSHAVTNTGTFAVQDATSQASLSIIDDWDESDRAKVNIIVGQAGIAGGTGADGVTVPRVTLATNVALPAGTNNIGDVDVLSIAAGDNNIGNVDVASSALPTGASTLAEQQTQTTALSIMDDWDNAASDGASVSGDVAHDSPDAGEPLKIGGTARTANPAAVAGLDRVNATYDDIGRQVVVLNHVRDLVVQQHASNTDGTETTILTAGAAGVFHDLVSIKFCNSSATAITVDVRDVTAGTVIDRFYVPAGQTVGAVYSTPFKQTTAAENWTMDASAAVSTLYCTVQAVKNV